MEKVRILYFAGLRDLTGCSEEWLELPAAARTVAALLLQLQRARPELAGRLGSVRAAVNEAFAEATDPVAPNDTVALIPPVSGG